MAHIMAVLRRLVKPRRIENNVAAEAVIRRKRLPLPLIDQPMAAGTEAVAGSVVATAEVAMAERLLSD